MRTFASTFDPLGRHRSMSHPAMLVSVSVMLALVSLAAAPCAAQEAAQEPPEAPCMASDPARQLDFWIGTWDVYDPEGRKAGVNVIERRLGGCLLLERWTGTRGSQGTSMNYWDPQRDTWRQVWVSDRGNVLDYRHGEYRDGAMRFRGVTIGASGDTTLQKLTFEDVAVDTVRQVFEASEDGGLTWDTTWVGIYIRRPADGGSGGAVEGGVERGGQGGG
jgi:hypothetical protein